jgi:23S rRNA pseudouridine955/2504/2580 synthase
VPIQGDGKYGGRAAFLSGEGLAPKLHLHAREIRFLNAEGDPVRVSAPLPPHMAKTWTLFGFDPNHDKNPFLEVGR